MNDIIITRATIKEIAQRIYDDVDSYDFQDSGYMLKDIELEVAITLGKLVHRITSEFEYFAFAGDLRFYSDSLDFSPRRHCDVKGCEMPVRADDIWCYWHGEIEDKCKRLADWQDAIVAQGDEPPF